MKSIIHCLLIILCFLFQFNTLCFSQETRGIVVQKSNNIDVVTGNTYAIILGISDYPYLKPLHYADKDAELFRDFLLSPAGGNVKSENMNVLLNEKATSANFWVKTFAWLRNKDLQKGDRLYFFFAGHGDAINKDEYFFLPYDCSPGGDKNNYLATGTIQIYNLKVRIADLSSKGIDVLLIMDACRSNELPGGAAGQKILGEAIAEKRSGETMMLAAGSGQESLEDRSIGNGHGLFTWYLIDGLTGNADADIDNGNHDGRVDLDEIESWVKRNVKKVAQQRFNHLQVPYFCCSGTQKNITKVDTVFFNRWLSATKMNADAGENLLTLNKPVTPRAATEITADTGLIKLYNLFNGAIKKYNLMGDSAAEYWYNKMLAGYPTHFYTEEAKYTLTTELINFAQEKINLYLTGSDYKYQSNNDSSDKRFLFEQRLKAVADEPFYKVAGMLDKGIRLSREFDTTIERRYLSKLYFLKARGELTDDEYSSWVRPKTKEEIKKIWKPGVKQRIQTDLKEALGYAYEALRMDSNAAYIYHLLAKFQYCKDWFVFYDSTGDFIYDWSTSKITPDSVSYYEKKAIDLAPNWFYAYYHWGNFYTNLAPLYTVDTSFYGNYKNDPDNDTAETLLRKSLEKNPSFLPANRRLANVLNRKKDYKGALDIITKTRLLYPDDYPLKNDLIKYHFKLNNDSGMYYYRKFTDSNHFFHVAVENLGHYFINKADLPMSIFICKEELAHPAWAKGYCDCDKLPAYALSKNNTAISDTLFKIISSSDNSYVKSRMFYELAYVYEERKDITKAIEYFLKAIEYDPDFIDPPYNLAFCYSILHNKEKALYYLEQALKYGNVLFSSIYANKELEFILDTNEFKALMIKYFPDEVK